MIPEKIVHKFAIVGTTSSGKTTLTKAYGRMFRHNPDREVLEEGARIYFEQHPRTLEKPVHVYPVQLDIQDFVRARELALQCAGPQLIVSDRSVIDPIVLLDFYHPEENSEGLLTRVKHWLPRYTGFIVTDPAGIPYDQDRFRQETPEERLKIHDHYTQFLDNHSLPFTVVTGDLAERVEQSNAFIVSRTGETTIFERT